MHVDTLQARAFAAMATVMGVPATVTRPVPDDTPVETSVVWQDQPPDESRPFAAEIARREPRRTLAVPRAALSSLPKGTVIVAAERFGDTAKSWVVDGAVDALDPDAFRVFVKQQLGPVGGA
jgi:hypothetical protein